MDDQETASPQDHPTDSSFAVEAYSAKDGIRKVGDILSDQAAGMLMQDVESFSQGFMQIMMAAIAKSTEKIVKTDGAEGEKSLTIAQNALNKLPVFIDSMAKSSQMIEDITPHYEGIKIDDSGQDDDDQPADPKS